MNGTPQLVFNKILNSEGREVIYNPFTVVMIEHKGAVQYPDVEKQLFKVCLAAGHCFYLEAKTREDAMRALGFSNLQIKS